jgi:hypothetical protein
MGWGTESDPDRPVPLQESVRFGRDYKEVPVIMLAWQFIKRHYFVADRMPAAEDR